MTTPLPPTSNMRASLRRAKAGGERFLGGMMAGATSRRLQVRAFADEWAAANIVAEHAVGPLWVVLGDSTSQGLGATTREAGYVGVVHEALRRRDAWRVINLSRAGAGVADVLARQLPGSPSSPTRSPPRSSRASSARRTSRAACRAPTSRCARCAPPCPAAR